MSDFSWLTVLSKCLRIMELRFEAMLYSYFGNENTDAGHTKCSRGAHLARGQQVTHPWYSLQAIDYSPVLSISKITYFK